VGAAEVWYKSLENIPTTWEEWQWELEMAFPLSSYAPTLERDMMAQKGFNKSHIDYFYAKLGVCDVCALRELF